MTENKRKNSPLVDWQKKFEARIVSSLERCDPVHSLDHIKRVVATAIKLAKQEGADLDVVIPAAWLHDLEPISKESPLRSKASTISAGLAINFLRSIDYPEQHFDNISHAIAAHSYSANIPATTIEAKVVQDADRLDAIGAIGIARCLMYGGSTNRPLYHSDELIPMTRECDERNYCIDHFFQKLYKLPALLNTASGKAEGEKRVEYMKGYVAQLQDEVDMVL